jgi:multidrug efflux pump subunit AcrB
MKKPLNKKRIILFATLFIILVLLFRYVPTNIFPPSENAFELICTEVPEQMKVGETLTVTATLVNKSMRSYSIVRGFSIISLGIVEEGTELASPLIGITSVLFAEINKKKTITYFFDKPGTYVLHTWADFGIGNHSYDYFIKRRIIQVTE